MDNHALELLLLTTTLSQINNRGMIIRLFVESMNNIFSDHTFTWLEKSETDENSLMEICTRKKNYGYLSFTVSGPSDPATVNLIHNANQLLAVILEKAEQENNLHHLVEKRTAELKRANEDLEKTNRNLYEQITSHMETLESLRISEEKYRSLLNKIQTAIVIHNGKGEIIDSNPLADILLGLSGTSMKGKELKDRDWKFLREDGSPMPVPEYPASRVLSSGRVLRNYVVGISQPDRGKTVWTLVNGEPEYDEKGGIIQVILSFIDITDRKITDEILRQVQKMDAIGQLAGGVAHDFNNMLGGIVAAAQILQNPKRNLDEKGLKFVDLILDASKQAAELTGKLLAFGRKTELSFALTDTHFIIDETVALLTRTIDRRIKIRLTKGAEFPAVLGDRTALQNILLNLGINASHAMPDGGSLMIATRNIYLNENYCRSSPFEIEPGNYLEIEVRDTGSGIAPENIDRIFEPFYTTKEPGKGTGLGLSTVYGTIQNHHGAINVYSEVGTGTVFHLYLPSTGDVPSEESPENETFQGSGTILLVDDEELIRITGKATLEEMGYKVILAENGAEALKIFGEKHGEIDLVIMDMLMPEMNGSDAYHRMRKVDEKCRVIISSGFTRDENLEDLKRDGLAGFIQKPFRNFELSRLIAEILNV